MDNWATKNTHTALAVHYDAPLGNAQKEFERRGYEGIRNFRYDDRTGPMGCEEARKEARSRADIDEEGCFEYEGDEFFPDAINVNRCRIYRFEFGRYTGKPGDGIHKRNCRNCGR